MDPNSTIMVPKDRHGLYAIDILDPDLVVGQHSVYYFHDMIVEMQKWGYEEGKTLFGFGYDFSQSNRWVGNHSLCIYVLSFKQLVLMKYMWKKDTMSINLKPVSMLQGGFTAGSTTSESSCEAVRLSYNILVEILKSLKEKMQLEVGSINWETPILQAYMQSSFYVPGINSMSYLNYGAAASEVEIDILTGETGFLQTYIIYDCGQRIASGEPPLLLAASVHCATRAAVKEAITCC